MGEFMNTYTDNELFLAAQIGALRYGCEQALALLQNGAATETDALRVELLLSVILNPKGSSHE